MKWNHILDKQPEDGESIIQIDPPYEGHYCIGMRDYYQKCSFKEVLEFYNQNELKLDFWWISAIDFPFPDQPERSKREDSSIEEMRCSEHCGNTVREVQ